MDASGAWQRLCTLIDDDEQLWPSVSAALELEDADPWETLLDGLDDAGALAFLDTADTGMELVDALNQLPRVFRLQPDLDEANDTDDLDGAIRAADATLSSEGCRIVELGQADQDARALVVVRSADVAELTRLAAELEQPLVPLG